MAYVLTDGAGTVLAYPYNLAALQLANPNTSYPPNPTDAQFAEWGIFPVEPTPRPSYDVIAENIAEGQPLVLVNTQHGDGARGPTYRFVQRWIVTPASAAEIAARTAQYEAQTAEEAARRLEQAKQFYIDAMVEGHGFTAEMTDYIAALTDPTTLPGYPAVSAWPELPAQQIDPANDQPPAQVVTPAQLTQEVQQAVVQYLPLTGGTVTGETRFDEGLGLGWIGIDPVAINLLISDDMGSIAEFTPAGMFFNGSGSTAVSAGQITLLNANNQPAMPVQDEQVAVKGYVDAEIASAVAPLARLPRLTINLETSTGSITTSPVIANALTTIGNTNGFTINLGFGEYREPGPVVINDKWQLQIVGPASANTACAAIKNGLTIQNSSGVRLQRVQIDGPMAVASRTGNGQQFERCQITGNLSLSGTGGFMMFVDCEFGGNVTVDAAFAGTIYFVRCSFANASGVYTFNQTSPVQVIMSDCSGIPNAGIAKASFSGIITYKAGTQALFVNGLPLLMSGTTAQRPATAMTGFMFFDTTLNRPVWRSGTSWRDATGATA